MIYVYHGLSGVATGVATRVATGVATRVATGVAIGFNFTPFLATFSRTRQWLDKRKNPENLTFSRLFVVEHRGFEPLAF